MTVVVCGKLLALLVAEENAKLVDGPFIVTELIAHGSWLPLRNLNYARADT